MALPLRLLLAAFLVAHALIHTAFIAPRPPETAGAPPWPFELSRSCLLRPMGADPGVLRVLGLALLAATTAGFGVAAIATLGLLPARIWSPSAAFGAFASAALLIVFFHSWLIIGLAIDLAISWAALVAHWSPT
jgi:hypothetical protein